jgi:CheB methylesterase
MANILSRAGPLPACYARDVEAVENGHIYVAPADYHLLNPGRLMRVVRGPKENRTRPAVDPLFRSAALSYGPRVIGLVLSGALDDGTAGLRVIKMLGVPPWSRTHATPSSAPCPYLLYPMPPWTIARRHLNFRHCSYPSCKAERRRQLGWRKKEAPAGGRGGSRERPAHFRANRGAQASVMNLLPPRLALPHRCPPVKGLPTLVVLLHKGLVQLGLMRFR